MARIAASDVTFAVEDPTTADAQWCIQQYFDELNERFETGFDPTLGISAEAHELVPPSGALIIAHLADFLAVDEQAQLAPLRDDT